MLTARHMSTVGCWRTYAPEPQMPTSSPENQAKTIVFLNA
jgi:hypothetical protein